MVKINFSSALICLCLCIIGCDKEIKQQEIEKPDQYIVVLGVVQDAGFPHINNPDEWNDLEKGVKSKKLVSSLGLVDRKVQKKYIFEATPDMPQQLHELESETFKNKTLIDGVFITHAHIGHYTGLMYFGREAMGAKNIPVYAMPKMNAFLAQNGPWSQLVTLKNINIQNIEAETNIKLTSNLSVVPFLVPHRDEFSETVGYKIIGTKKSALFIPDINKWSFWERDIVEEIKKVDMAFIDATFYEDGEIPRPMSEVPHPFIKETASLFENESSEVKSKIIFIHFNHSNPLLDNTNKDRKRLKKEGYRFATKGMRIEL